MVDWQVEVFDQQTATEGRQRGRARIWGSSIYKPGSRGIRQEAESGSVWFVHKERSQSENFTNRYLRR